MCARLPGWKVWWRGSCLRAMTVLARTWQLSLTTWGARTSFDLQVCEYQCEGAAPMMAAG